MNYSHKMNISKLALCTALIFSSAFVVAQADDGATKEVKIKELTLNIPDTWLQKESSSQFRLAEFDVPAAKDDQESAELVLFHFQGAAGKTDANISRWIGQFEPEGRVAKFKQGKTDDGSYVWVDISGTYKKPVGAPFLGRFEKMEDARVVSVILNTSDDVYYLKLVGTQEVLKDIVPQFRTAFGGKTDSEEDYKFEL